MFEDFWKNNKELIDGKLVYSNNTVEIKQTMDKIKSNIFTINRESFSKRKEANHKDHIPLIKRPDSEEKEGGIGRIGGWGWG